MLLSDVHTHTYLVQVIIKMVITILNDNNLVFQIFRGKSLVENMAVERKPGLFWKRWKKAWCIFLGLIHIQFNDEVKLTHYFIHLNTKCVWYI